MFAQIVKERSPTLCQVNRRLSDFKVVTLAICEANIALTQMDLFNIIAESDSQEALY